MGTLLVSGSDFGNVISSDKSQEFPCMDTNYRELSWTFVVLKQFASFSDLLSFERNTIPTYFSNRSKSVSYGSDSESDVVLQSFKRKDLLTPGYGGQNCLAEYEVVFTKEG